MRLEKQTKLRTAEALTFQPASSLKTARKMTFPGRGKSWGRGGGTSRETLQTKSYCHR